MPRNQDTCTCAAYPFPHRLGSGKCPTPYYICEACKGGCDPKVVDFGIGPGEAWGAPFVDSDKQVASDCCEAPVLCFSGELAELALDEVG